MPLKSIPFTKYQGAGNDFIMIDNRSLNLARKDIERYKRWCDRRFGIGADGLILVQNTEGADFEMVYYNADGSEGSLCGNGGRCAISFANSLGLFDKETSFLAVDGLHKGQLLDAHTISLAMGDVTSIESIDTDFYVHTGSPHHVRLVEKLDQYPVLEEGQKIRWSANYQPGGTNVNFIEPISSHQLKIRTFERGVEAETLACGTGVTAAALVWAKLNAFTGNQCIQLIAVGGDLQVNFIADEGGFHDIVLTGPAKAVFSGIISDYF